VQREDHQNDCLLSRQFGCWLIRPCPSPPQRMVRVDLSTKQSAQTARSDARALRLPTSPEDAIAQVSQDEPPKATIADRYNLDFEANVGYARCKACRSSYVWLAAPARDRLLPAASQGCSCEKQLPGASTPATVSFTVCLLSRRPTCRHRKPQHRSPPKAIRCQYPRHCARCGIQRVYSLWSTKAISPLCRSSSGTKCADGGEVTREQTDAVVVEISEDQLP
jgi:hypothetical protein